MFYKNASGAFVPFLTNVSATMPVIQAGIQATLCLDFQKGSMGMMMNGWTGSCAAVSSAQRLFMANYPIMQMMNVNGPVGNQLGFILNGVNISGFLFGTIVSQVGM